MDPSYDTSSVWPVTCQRQDEMGCVPSYATSNGHCLISSPTLSQIVSNFQILLDVEGHNGLEVLSK